MKTLLEIINSHHDWSGDRNEFLELLSVIENEDPKNRMLFTKKRPVTALPINLRRIQWFISKNMMPGVDNKTFGYQHLVFYWGIIHLRKQKMTFPQLENLNDRMDVEQASLLLGSVKEGSDILKSLSSSSEFNSETVSKGLKRMGRKEGRPIKSTLIRLAITPWCHLTVDQNKLDNLKSEDVNVIAEAFRQSLSKIIDQS